MSSRRIIYSLLAITTIVVFSSINLLSQEIGSINYAANESICLSSLLNIDTTKLGGKLDCLIEIFTADENVLNNRPPEWKEKKGKRIVIVADTLGFRIRKIMSKDGGRINEYYLNSFIGLEYRKVYEMGKLIKCGFSSGSEKIGSWKYLSESGELDSIANYEDFRLMSFCDFFEIAKSFGMVGKSSRLPVREEFIRTAEKKDLTIKILKSISSIKAGWLSLLMFDQEHYEKEWKFSSNFSYIDNTWNVTKNLRDSRKGYCFGIKVNLKRRTILQFESVIKH